MLVTKEMISVIVTLQQYSIHNKTRVHLLCDL